MKFTVLNINKMMVKVFFVSQIEHDDTYDFQNSQYYHGHDQTYDSQISQYHHGHDKLLEFLISSWT